MNRIKSWLRWLLRWLFQPVACCGCGGPEAAVELIPTPEWPAAEQYCRTCYDSWSPEDQVGVRWLAADERRPA